MRAASHEKGLLLLVEICLLIKKFPSAEKPTTLCK
jgi:hypothetical protein